MGASLALSLVRLPVLAISSDSASIIILSVVTIVVAAILSAWAHRADCSHGLTIGLYVVFGGASVISLLIGLALLLVRRANGVSGSEAAGILFLVLGLGIGLPLLRPVRVAIAGVTPMNPDSRPDMIGLSLLIAFAALVLYSSYQTPTTPNQATVSSVSAWEVVVQEGTFAVVAFLAVGTLLTRDATSSLRRLGLFRPTARQIAIAIGAVIVVFVISVVASLLTKALQPNLNSEINQNVKTMTEDLTSGWGALLLGVSAGVGEELLFRGALQPRYGIVITSLIFSIAHVQYGFSIVVLGVFLMGIVLGLVRKYLNTTASMTTHVIYDVVAVSPAIGGLIAVILGTVSVLALRFPSIGRDKT